MLAQNKRQTVETRNIGRSHDLSSVLSSLLRNPNVVLHNNSGKQGKGAGIVVEMINPVGIKTLGMLDYLVGEHRAKVLFFAR
ncbi:MAG: hypothetical protein HQM14_19455 [SAR324 cluster bacterium]|nr:hypothetical protein [SAR324 cluster bacterium]